MKLECEESLVTSVKGITGCVSLLQGTAINKKLTRKWSLFGTGVTTDNFTPKGALIMVASVLLYAIIQVPRPLFPRALLEKRFTWQCPNGLPCALRVHVCIACTSL